MKALAAMDRRLVTILLIVFVQMAGAAMILPVLPLYAQQFFDLSPESITLLAATFFAGQFIAGPILGRWSDRIGRVPILIVSQIGTAVSFLMLALAPSAIFLFLARILDGLTGGNIVVAQAYITDITPPEKRTQSLGLVFAMFGLGFVIGPALGGILSATLGPRVPYIVAAIAATAVVILTRVTLEESLSEEDRQANNDSQANKLRPAEIASNTPLLLLLAIGFIVQLTIGTIQGTFSLFGEAIIFADLDPRFVNLGLGLLFSAMGIMQIITQVAILPRLLTTLGDRKLLLVGGVIRAVSCFAPIYFATVLFSAPWIILFAFGSGLQTPPLQSLVTRAAKPEMRGGILGVFQSTQSLATIISTAVSGVLFAASPYIPWWAAFAFSAIAIIPSVFLLNPSIQLEERTPSPK